MKRVAVEPRPGWVDTVEREGLGYAVERLDDGSVGEAYWHEEHAYEFTADQIDHLEAVTGELHEMCVQAAGHLLERPELFASLELPPGAHEAVAHSYATERAASLYGRFDVTWDGEGPVKMLEYNGDTPTGLVEASVTQWRWLEDVHPGLDQWNLLHEYLVHTWRRLGAGAPGGVVHLGVGKDEPDEDWCTVAYLADCAAEAGLSPVVLTMDGLGWHEDDQRFVDLDGAPVHTCYRLYPWEWMLDEPFAAHLLGGRSTVHWVEPLWKVLLSGKTLLVALDEIYPGHENLLPARLGAPGHWPEGYVSKPVFGWEGSGIEVVTPHLVHRQEHVHSAGRPLVHQRYTHQPSFGGAHPVLGPWVVGGRPAGLGIREQDSPVTDTGARFVPHYITAPRPDAAQVARWVEGAG